MVSRLEQKNFVECEVTTPTPPLEAKCPNSKDLPSKHEIALTMINSYPILGKELAARKLMRQLQKEKKLKDLSNNNKAKSNQKLDCREEFFTFLQLLKTAKSQFEQQLETVQECQSRKEEFLGDIRLKNRNCRTKIDR